MYPTCKASTCVPFLRNSMRSALVKLQAAAFVAEYAASTGWANQVASDSTFMMAPPPFAEMTGAKAWVAWIMP